MNRLLFCSIIFLIVAGCAGQRPPEGGPVDSTPPEIISVVPQPNTINFSDNKIVIEFSEYVDRRSTEGAIFFSPSIEDKEFDWSGTELEITFNTPLRKYTTYVVSIGTDVVDLRAGNRMAQSFSLSFSTGDKIDNGSIQGKVFDEKPDGIMIFSYRLNNILPDTLNPAKSKPDYLTQTGKNGEFLLMNLAPGTYRLFAVKDEYRNLLYDPETDAAGTTDDVTLTMTDTAKSGLSFIIAKEDTTAPRLSTVQTVDDHHVVVQFSEDLDSSSIAIHRFAISDTLFQHRLKIEYLFPNNEKLNSFTLVTEKQKAQELYVLSVDSVKDRSGFIINSSARAKQFSGSAVRDTVPAVLVGTTMTSPGSKIFPNEPLQFIFNDALRTPVSDTAIVLRRSKDSTIISKNISYRNASSVLLSPKLPLLAGEQYTVRLRLNGITDTQGNSTKDSSLMFSFAVEDPENYGSIEGRFAGFSGSRTMIEAVNIYDKQRGASKAIANSSGEFSFKRLTDGRYSLTAVDDSNKNMRLDAGTLFPFSRAERFSVYKDTIRVRARWPVDGVLFKTN